VRPDDHGAGYLQLLLDTGSAGSPRTGDNDVPDVIVKINKDEHNFTAPYFESTFEDSMRDAFKRIFPIVRTNIMRDSQSFGKFIFPGTGVFDFKNPFFSQGGDLVVQVDYQKSVPLRHNSSKTHASVALATTDHPED